MKQTILFHSLLDYQGGAARIRGLLQDYCAGKRWCVRKTCEIADGADNEVKVVTPCSLVREITGQEIVHIHSTGSWMDLLQALKQQAVQPVITLHDARLLTGGCASPVTCENWRQGCAGDCPQGVRDSARRAAFTRSLMRDVRPVLVAPSRWMADMARTVFPSLKVFVVPNGVPWTSGRSDRLTYYRSMVVPTVLFVAHGGEAAGLKGGASWRSLWKRIKARVPACKGFFVGGDRCGTTGDLTLLPYLSPDLLASLMSRCTLLIYPTEADNHPLIILEAMAQKLVCVACDAGGISEQIRNGENGVLVSPGDQDALVEKSIELLEHPAVCHRMGDIAWETGKKRFSLERMGAGYERVYAWMRSGDE